MRDATKAQLWLSRRSRRAERGPFDPVLQLDGEHGVGQWLDNRAFDLDRISFRHGRCWVPFSHGMPAQRGPTHERAAYQITHVPDNGWEAGVLTGSWSGSRDRPR